MMIKRNIEGLVAATAITLVFFSAASFASAQESSDKPPTDWNETRKEALVAAKKKDFAHSETILHQMIKRAGSKKGFEAHLILALEDLASVYTSEKKYGDAREIYKKILVLEERKYGLNSPKLIKPLNDVIKVTCINGKCYDTIPELKRLLSIRRKAYGYDSREIPVMLLLLGEANEKEGKYAEAISYFTEAVNTQKKISGVNSAMVIALSQNVERASKEQLRNRQKLEKAHAIKSTHSSVR